MKKIFTLTCALALCATTAFAQRTIDVTSELVSPAQGSTITDEVPFDIQVKVTNTGPDDMKAGDSLLCIVFLGNSQIHPVQLLTKTDAIMNGGSMTYTITGITIDLSSGGNGTICAVVGLLNSALPDTVFDNRIAGNNIGCQNYFFSNPSALNAVDELQSSIYPNPLSGAFATVSFVAPQAGQAQVRVYDMAGRVVVEQNVATFGGSQEVEIAAGDMKNGVYIYEIQMGEVVVRNKFTVNR